MDTSNIIYIRSIAIYKISIKYLKNIYKISIIWLYNINIYVAFYKNGVAHSDEHVLSIASYLVFLELIWFIPFEI